MNKEEKKSVEEKKPNLTIEELVKYIKESDELKKPPKKRIYYKTKRLIAIIALLVIFIFYTAFIWKPFEFKIKFKEETYNIYGININTFKNDTVRVGSKIIELDENIVKVLPYVNYKDKENRYIVFLSENGNVYRYNIDMDEIYKYSTFPYHIASIEEQKLDMYTVIQLVTNKRVKYILGASEIIKSSVDELKIIDNVHYEFNDYIVYSRNTGIYVSNYENIRHFSMEEEDWTDGTELETCFVDKSEEKVSYKSVVVRKYEDNLYIYGITADGKFTCCKINIEEDSNKLSINGNIKQDIISFNKKVDSFVQDYFSNTSVRVTLEGTTNIIEIFLDKLIIGALSNDTRLLAYNTDFIDGTKYNVVEDNGVYVRYDGQFYTCYMDGELQLVYINDFGELIKVGFYFNHANIETDTVIIEMDNSLSVDSIYYEKGRVYIRIKETIKKEYVVFENTTEVKYHEYLMEDFLNKQIGGQKYG